MSDNVTQFPGKGEIPAKEEDALPTPAEMVDGYLELAGQHLGQISELSLRLERIVTKDDRANTAVVEATRAARQSAQVAFFWMHQAGATVVALIKGIEDAEKNKEGEV